MTIARVIADRSGDLISCDVGTSVAAALALLAEKRIGALPVYKNGAIAGIFSERDVVYQLHSSGPAMLEKLVGEVMTAPPITVSSDTPVMEALGLMTRRRIRHLPVVDAGTVSGFVSIGDLVKYRIDKVVSEAEAMRDYIQNA